MGWHDFGRVERRDGLEARGVGCKNASGQDGMEGGVVEHLTAIDCSKKKMVEAWLFSVYYAIMSEILKPD